MSGCDKLSMPKLFKNRSRRNEDSKRKENEKKEKKKN